MKKRYAYLLTGALVLSSLSGCGKETPEDILKEMANNTKEATSFAGNMDMNMAVDLSQSGVSMGVELGVSGDMEVVNDPAAFHFDGEVYFNMMNLSMDMEMYGVEEDQVLHLYTKVADQWTHAEQSLEEANKAQEEMDMSKISSDILSKMTMEEETKKEKDREQYIFHTVLTGEELNKWLSNMEEISKEDLEEVGLSELDVDVELAVDKEKKLPAGFTLDLNESLQKVLDQAMEELTEASGQELSAKISNCALVLEFQDFNAIEKIEVPKEALDVESISGDDLLSGLEGGVLGAEEDLLEEESDPELNVEEPEITPTEVPEPTVTEEPEAEPTDVPEEEEGEFEPEAPRQAADGSYILKDYDESMEVSIKTPEGFQEGYMDKNFLSYSKETSDQEDTFVSMTYNIQQFDEYYTEQDFIDAFMEQEMSAQEYGYKSLECKEPQTIQVGNKKFTCLTMDFSYDGTDKNRQLCLLAPLDGEKYLQCMVSESALEGSCSLQADENLVKLLLEGVVFEEKNVL